MQRPVETVILVNDDDIPIGTAEKLAAHRAGQLHRAVSVMIWDEQGRLLLQRRQLGKYHSGGLWSNTCCGHPRPGESVQDAANRRLFEEMGFSTSLTLQGTFRYQVALDGGLNENEIVHIFSGIYSGVVTPNPEECEDFAWKTIEDIREDFNRHPDRFTAWFTQYVAAGWPVAGPPSTHVAASDR